MFEHSFYPNREISSSRFAVNRAVFSMENSKAVDHGYNLYNSLGFKFMRPDSEDSEICSKLANLIGTGKDLTTKVGGVVFGFDLDIDETEVTFDEKFEEYTVFIPAMNFRIESAENWGIHEQVFKNVMNIPDDGYIDLFVEVCMNCQEYTNIQSTIDDLLWRIWDNRNWYGLETHEEVIKYFYIFVIPCLKRYAEMLDSI